MFNNSKPWLTLGLAAALLSACASGSQPRSADTIALQSTQKPAASSSLFKFPVTLRMEKYQDARRNALSRKIGEIKATVMGMSGPDLLAEDDVAGMVTAAMKNRFEAAGFQVTDAAGAQFEASGTVREFSLNIDKRDELAMVVETTLREANGGNVIWSGVVTEKTDRFAGVMGNTKKDVAKYLDASLGAVSQKTSDAIAASLKQVHPELFTQTVAEAKTVPGVTVFVAPQPQAPAAPAAYAAAPSAVAAQQAAAPAGGYLSVATLPPRAKVYLGDVYYGLSPLRLELEPGIHMLRIKLEGFQPATEKVSVRKGETTEFEATLEK